MLALASVTTSAFSPAQALAPAMRAPAPIMGLESELGATGPLLPYWDPLGLSVGKPEKFQRWRAVEIKHGRIAMMATTGYIAQECIDFPGYLSISENIKFSDVPNGIRGFA